MTYRIVKKGSTGKYHLSPVRGALSCNGIAGAHLFNQVTTDLAMRARDEAFCRKCFGMDPRESIDSLLRAGLLQEVKAEPMYRIEKKENSTINGERTTSFELCRYEGDQKTFAGKYFVMGWNLSDDEILKAMQQ